MSEENNTQTEENKDTGNQPRMFTQAEKDKEIAMIINRERDKFKDYDELKTQLDKLAAEKKERDMAEKSEVEKLQAINSELTTELTNVRGELTSYQKKQLRMDVLNGSKYQSLPRAYKELVSLSDNIEDIQASADKVLEEYNNDFGHKTSETFGIPESKNTTISEPTKVAASPQDLAQSLRSKVASVIKGAGRS